MAGTVFFSIDRLHHICHNTSAWMQKLKVFGLFLSETFFWGEAGGLIEMGEGLILNLNLMMIIIIITIIIIKMIMIVIIKK